MLYGVPALRRTGRYPWGVGFYDMKGPLMVPLDTIMLPRIMRDMGYRTHAIGKFVRPACLMHCPSTGARPSHKISLQVGSRESRQGLHANIPGYIVSCVNSPFISLRSAPAHT